jgi:hypothetical protein
MAADPALKKNTEKAEMAWKGRLNQEQKTKTPKKYNGQDSLVVTDPTTSPAVRGLIGGVGNLLEMVGKSGWAVRGPVHICRPPNPLSYASEEIRVFRPENAR